MFCFSGLKCLFKTSITHNSATDQALDHYKFDDKPGQVWDAKKQCELLLVDSDAKVMNTEMNFDSSKQQAEVSTSFKNNMFKYF